MQNAVCWFIWFWYRFSSSFVRSFRLAVNMLSLQILRATKPTFKHNIHHPQALSTYSRLFLLPTWHAHILIIHTHARTPARTHSYAHKQSISPSHQYPNIYMVHGTVYVNTCVCMSKIHFDSCSWNQNDKWCSELPASVAAAELMLHWLKKNVTKISKCAIVNFPLIMDAWNIR